MLSLSDAPWLLVAGYTMAHDEQPFFQRLLGTWLVFGTLRTVWYLVCWLASTRIGSVCWDVATLYFYLRIAVAAVLDLGSASRTRRTIAFCIFIGSLAGWQLVEKVRSITAVLF